MTTLSLDQMSRTALQRLGLVPDSRNALPIHVRLPLAVDAFGQDTSYGETTIAYCPNAPSDWLEPAPARPESRYRQLYPTTA
ncbi:MAG: hypothetical protein RQ847_04390 [Wenzhouxiangellaceae bacterium]|nr:hypothetical protein [Wenzhouxiangellaceae bacterium]